MISMMNASKTFLIFNIFFTITVIVDTFNPFTATADFFFKLWKQSFGLYQSCDSESFNAAGLRADLHSKLFGQHIASSIIQKAVTGFMRDKNPQKPLVLSLNGPCGTGKNFVCELIAGNIYKKGLDSSSVHVFVSTLHFPHKRHIDTYKTQLQQWIKGNVSNCERSVFIFDEMDKMHPGLIDSIKPYLDYYDKLDGVSYRKAIFIFLSNAGGHTITETALQFWREGLDREKIEIEDLETALAESVSNTEGGLGQSELINENMIDYFIPFLPLEYRHVVQCVMSEMKAAGYNENQRAAEKTARDLEYFPKFERVFSARGCKTVKKRLLFYI